MQRRAALRSQQEYEREKARELHENTMRNGVRTILEYAPICVVGTYVGFDALVKLSNYENKCWVQAPATDEYCDFWRQLGVGFIAYMIGGTQMGMGVVEVCESNVCAQERCCKECCTICAQECCWLLGVSYNKK